MRAKRVGLADILLYILWAIIAFVCVYPFIYLLSMSLSTVKEATRIGFHLYPREVTFEAYREVLSMPAIWRGYGNTIFVTVVGTAINLLLTAFTAYPLSKRYFPWRNGFTAMIIFTMLFSGGMIPTYILINSLGMIDTLWALIIPGAVSAYNMFIMRNFFQTIPDSLEESAKLDGANDITILFRIILPLSTPVLATLGLFYAVGHWNDFFSSILYITDQKNWVLQMVVQQLIIARNTSIDQLVRFENISYVLPQTTEAALVMVVTVPILVVYPFLQKYFVKGVLIGSLKG